MCSSQGVATSLGRQYLNATLRNIMSGKISSFVLGVVTGIYLSAEYPEDVAFVMPKVREAVKKVKTFMNDLEKESQNKTEE